MMVSPNQNQIRIPATKRVSLTLGLKIQAQHPAENFSISSVIASSGVRQPSVFLGLPLSRRAMS
ncbi:MAG: hypothetical protein AB7E55_00890, partial [Pigmentiphaga sp.]